MPFNKHLIVETPRLIIRPFTMGDREEAFQIMRDKDMVRYTPDDPWKSLEDAEKFLRLALWLYDSEHENFRHFLAVTLKPEGRLIGFCGVGGIAYDHALNEVFYSIGKDYWGLGYATEAAKAMLEYAFRTLKLQDIIGVVEPENRASSRVMEKIGMVRCGIVEGLPDAYASYNGEYLYRLSRQDYLLRKP